MLSKQWRILILTNGEVLPKCWNILRVSNKRLITIQVRLHHSLNEELYIFQHNNKNLENNIRRSYTDTKVLDDLIVYPPDDFTLLLICSAAIYYIDVSERQAWLQSFNSYDKFYRAPGDLRNF